MQWPLFTGEPRAQVLEFTRRRYLPAAQILETHPSDCRFKDEKRGVTLWVQDAV